MFTGETTHETPKNAKKNNSKPKQTDIKLGTSCDNMNIEDGDVGR